MHIYIRSPRACSLICQIEGQDVSFKYACIYKHPRGVLARVCFLVFNPALLFDANVRTALTGTDWEIIARHGNIPPGLENSAFVCRATVSLAGHRSSPQDGLAAFVFANDGRNENTLGVCTRSVVERNSDWKNGPRRCVVLSHGLYGSVVLSHV